MHIRNRIVQAYSNGEKFKVYIFIPLLPGFSGEVQNTQAIQTISITQAATCLLGFDQAGLSLAAVQAYEYKATINAGIKVSACMKMLLMPFFSI